MLQTKILPVHLAGIILCSSIPLGFSESLQVQIDQGLDTKQIQCNNPNHLLVERPNGKPACVTERTAEKTNWTIISNIMPTNSDNYWLPIPDNEREDFAKKFLAATGGSIIGEANKYGGYKTDPRGSIGFGQYEVIYRISELDVDITQTEKFVRDFMDSMGFEFTEGNFYYNEYSLFRDDPSNEIQNYFIYTEYNVISFKFSYRDGASVLITFTGWINNPDSIVFSITDDQALQYAKDFSNNLEENMNLLYGYDYENKYKCNLQKEANPQYPLEISVNKKVIGGVLYYESEVGLCVGLDKESLGLGDFTRILLHQDAVNGTDVFIERGVSGE